MKSYKDRQIKYLIHLLSRFLMPTEMNRLHEKLEEMKNAHCEDD